MSRAPDDYPQPPVHPVWRRFGEAGGIMLLAVMAVTVGDVAARALGGGLPGSVELVEYGMAAAGFLCLPYAHASRATVTVDILYQALPARWRRPVAWVTHLLGAGFVAAVSLALASQSAYVRGAGETSAVLGIPKYPFVALASLGAAMLFVALLADLRRS